MDEMCYRKAFDEVAFGLLVLVLALLSQCPARSRAGDDELRGEAALALAQVCVNEAGWDSRDDCRMIWQTVESRARTTEDRWRWLTTHSARVLSGRSCALGNCTWSRYLLWTDAPPLDWPRDARWDPTAWRRVRDWALALVDGRDRVRPCAGTPLTWGGRGLDEHVLARRNAARTGAGLAPLRVLECGETRNFGAGYPAR